MKKLRLWWSLGLSVAGLYVLAQQTFPVNDVKDQRAGAYALTNATVVVDAQTKLEKATLLIKDGLIEQVGTTVTIPASYTSIDLKGKYIYPSFIDLHSVYGLPVPDQRQGATRGNAFTRPEQILPATRGAYNANDAIKAHYNAAGDFAAEAKAADEYRKAGFGTVLTARRDGIARGTSALVTLRDGETHQAVLVSKAAAHYSFNRGTSEQNYPVSQMGMIALMRQTYLDADWYKSLNPRPFTDQTLEAWVNNQKLPQIYDAGSWINVLRADKLGDEFGVQYILRGGGDEYQRIKEIKASGALLIEPVVFPDAYDVEDPVDAEKVSLKDMKHWEMAPANLSILEANQVPFVLTADGLRNRTDFLTNVRKAVKYGLSPATALKAMTATPAEILGISNRLGTLKKGLIANFIITSGDLFDVKTIIHENWVQGQAHKFKKLDEPDFNGKYDLSLNNRTYPVEISGTPGGEYTAKIKLDDTTTVDGKTTLSGDLITLSFPTAKSGGQIRLSGWSTPNGWKGTGQLVDGSWINWSAQRSGDLDKKGSGDRPGSKDEKPELGAMIYPFMAHGRTTMAKSTTILIKNTTIWTNENEGILNDADVLIKDGKIARIGKNINEPGAVVVDGTGKHVTAGIIDEHSHIAASGINDVATNSGMVRIEDVLNSEDIGIYRALSGGVTAIQVLHGSANPIGGQSALIKLRWGAAPDELKIQGADPFIKFALGENVKRSSNPQSVRFPLTRMGVEQVYVDAFNNALAYEKAWKDYNALSASQKATAVKPRRDLADETMLEIVRKKRFISCHSYVQSEINMLMNVADQFGFKVNTFTHILEGYKVADKMKEHGVAASSFSDWWNYKWEVRYAIPYNAAILSKVGVITAINSDDAEMMRRLNQEAAKSVKYGGLSEVEALKMVTLNPAKMLHLDQRMGSIKVGKDADMVLWTDHPLSVYAKAQKTIVDGKVYFDLEEDAVMNADMVKERARLIQKMKDEKKSGASVQRPASRMSMELHCNSLEGEENFEEH